jgi:ABC-type Mn2+/Zn2+ transport system permease subunit
MLTENILLITIVGGFVAAASAYIGSIMVLKRMALVGDALSHVALPGMAIALTFNLNPILGAFVALTVAIIGIWYLGKKSDTYPEALVGVFFTASLALGVLITQEHELLEALFGSIEKLNFIEGAVTVALSLLVMVVTFYLSKKLVVMIISEDLAVSSGININRINLIYLLLVGLIVSLGIRFVGTLLMGALVIIPAVSARNITRSMGGYFLTSVILGVISALTGITFAFYYGLPVGAVVVLASITIYIFSLFLRKLTVTN